MARKFRVKKRDTLFDRLVFWIARKVKKEPELIYLDGKAVETKSILIANHNGAGVTAYRIFLKDRFMSWTAYQIFGGFLTRWKYLYHIFYRKKLKYKKFRSFILATLLGAVYPLVRIIVGFIPVYYDSRLIQTLKHSMESLNSNIPVFITPENAEEGYQKKEEGYPQEITELFKGFLSLSKIYYDKYKIDLPIYTAIYTTVGRKKIVVGKPMYYQELLKTYSQSEILEIFRNYMNWLYKEYSYNENPETENSPWHSAQAGLKEFEKPC